MNLIEDAIKKYGGNLDNVFVFPSRIVAMLWFQKSIQITGLKTVPAENSISWDNFKETNLISSAANSVPVSNIIRNIFAEYICRLNSIEAEKSKSIFNSIIPKSYANNSIVFSGWIAGILPQLDHFEKRSILKKKIDTDTDDFFLLKKLYSDFLKKNSFFEPSWYSSEFISYGKKYIIIYPELIEDFSEHSELLKNFDNFTYIHCLEVNAENINLDIYDNARSEIGNTVLQIEKLLSENIPMDEIAVSIPDIENYSAYIKREFALRGIPAEFRSGFKLGSEQSGRLFSLILDCVQNNFAFEFMKPIILNNHIPWKDKSGSEYLIRYGIKNNCAVSWRENPQDKEYKNIWIESFKINYESLEEEVFQKVKAKDWFYSFYNSVNKMYSSKTFSELQKNYFLFRENCINISEFSEKDNAILGRCISTLQKLIDLENKLFEYMPENRFQFFVSILEKEIYVQQNTGRAISIFPYRVAAGTPFKYHFILNCSQKQTLVRYDKLTFLRKDKRESLGVFEFDASPYFFYAYAESQNAVFSFTGHSFSGYSIANELLENENASLDNTSKKLSSLLNYDSFKNEETQIHNEIYSIQKIGAEHENLFKHRKDFSFINSVYNHTCSELSEAVIENSLKNGFVKISQSDLKSFYTCSVKWFLKKLLFINLKKYDAVIINSADIGILSHSVFENLYKRIKAEDKFFNKNNLDKYKSIAEEEIKKAADYSNVLKGGLAKPFIQSLSKRMTDIVDFVLKTDASFFDGYAPDWIEEWIEIEQDGILYCGKVDRVSFPQDERGAVIIDYKTGKVPAYSYYGQKDAENVELKDFQIPMYVFLVENKIMRNYKNRAENKSDLIDYACFFELKDYDVRKIISENPKSRQKSRKQFQAAVDSFIAYAKNFADKIRLEDFRKTDDVTFDVCADCELKHVCRQVYSVQ